MFGLGGGHLGDRASALVDGQLPVDEEEQAWAHAMHCIDCRRLIEREGWLKTRLRGLAQEPVADSPRPDLLGHLYDVGAWAEADAAERDRRGHRFGVVLAGAGSLGAAVIGLVVLTGAPTQEPVQPAQIAREPIATVGSDPLVMLDPFRQRCGEPTHQGRVPVNAATVCHAQ